MSASTTRPSRVKLYGVEGFIPVVEIGDAWSAAVAEDATTACALICLSSPGSTGSAQINRVPPAYVRLGAAALRAAGKFTGGSLRYVDIVAGHWQIETRKTKIVNSVMGLSGATGGVFSGSVACTVRGEIDLVVFNSDQGDGAPCPVTLSGDHVRVDRLDRSGSRSAAHAGGSSHCTRQLFAVGCQRSSSPFRAPHPSIRLVSPAIHADPDRWGVPRSLRQPH